MNADIEQQGGLRVLEEFRNFDGIDPIALWKDAKFGVNNFSKLTHIAVVAKPNWLKTIAKAVDYILPGKVKVFEPNQLEAARLWLNTAFEPNLTPGLQYVSNLESNLVEIVVEGKVTESDYERIVPQLKADVERHGKLKVLEEIRSFEGIDPMALWRDLRQASMIEDFTHVAVVADAQWLRTLADAVSSMIPAEVRSFERTQIEEARTWLRDAQQLHITKPN